MKGDNLFKEYWRRPDATAEAFDKDGWFKTGDTAASQVDAHHYCSADSKTYSCKISPKTVDCIYSCLASPNEILKSQIVCRILQTVHTQIS